MGRVIGALLLVLLPWQALFSSNDLPPASTAPARSYSVTLVLAARDESGALRAAAAVADPHSPIYRHFYSQAAWIRRFGPDPAAVHALIAWLTAAGARPAPWNGGIVLRVRGPATRLAALLGGAGFSPAHLPRRFRALVRAVLGLNSLQTAASPWHASASLNAGASAYAITQVTSAYDFAPLYAAGLHGERTRIALVELAPYDRADVAAFAARLGHGLTLHDHQVDAGTVRAASNVEATVDIELLTAVAPAAAIDVWEAPADSDGQGLIDAYSDIASDPTVDVLGLSWVTCEPAAARIPGFLAAEHLLFAQMAARGTTIVSATGDAGAYGCADPAQAPSAAGNTQPVVSVPASDPYVLGVGATDLSLTRTGAASRIASETAWSCPADRHPACAATSALGAASGGGLSRIYTTSTDDLSWQTGPGVHNRLSTGGRQVPDVAASGSSGLGDGHGYAIYYRHAWTVGGGTSAAMPIWAGLVALADQDVRLHGGSSFGWITPLVYHLGAAPRPYRPFHDIVKGNDLLYAAGPGWDYASGWGSPDAWNFVRDAASLAAGHA